MPLKSEVVSVGTGATLISTAGTAGDKKNITMVNNSGVTIYLGGADVTTANGFPWASGTERQIELGVSDVLYGCVAAGTANITVLRSRA